LGKVDLTRRGSLVLLGVVLSFFFSSPIPANGLSLAALADKAGLPYPEDIEGTVFLKQASVIFEARSRWGSVEGYPPWHSVGIYQTASYLLENSGAQKTINVTFPMLTSPTQSGNGLTFRVDGNAMNYSGMRWVQVLDKDGLCCLETLELYWLTLTIPAGGRTNVTVQVPHAGAADREATFNFYMTNASRWAGPVESFIFSFHIIGGALASSTIPSSANTTSTAIWNIANQTPTQDLAISWMITEPEPPFRPFSSYDPLPLIVAGVAAGITGIGVLLHLRKRSTTPSENEKLVVTS